MEPIKVVDGLLFAEGPAWDGGDGLYCSNCDSDYVTRYDLKTGAITVPYRRAEDRYTFEKTNGMTFYEDGSLFACDFGRKAIIQIHPDGRMELFADKCGDGGFKGPNDLAFDPQGNLYFSDPTDSDEKNPVGCVYRVEKGNRKATRVADGMAFPNGVAFSADARHLYVAESSTFRILRFDVQPDGGLSGRATYCQFPQDYVPDGMNFDAVGNLWVALYTPGAVGVVDTSGALTREIKMPGRGCTNVEFAGADLKTLFITEADSKGLYRIPVETPGLPLFCAPEPRT